MFLKILKLFILWLFAFELLGIVCEHLTAGGYDGGQAQYLRVPYADFGPEIIPEGISDEDALLREDHLGMASRGRPVGTDWWYAETDTAVLRLAGAVLIEAHDEWQDSDRRYLSDGSMALLNPPAPTAIVLRSSSAESSPLRPKRNCRVGAPSLPGPPSPHFPKAPVAYPAARRISASVTAAPGSGSCPIGCISLLPRSGVCPLCCPVISTLREGAHTGLPA